MLRAANTTVADTAIHTYVCNISPPYSIITTDNGITITDAVFFYGTQGGLATLQTINTGNGTFNSGDIFSSISFPTPAASETASTVAPVKATVNAVNTVTMAPVGTAFNVATTTAGAFYSVSFTPTTAIVWKTNLQQLLLTVRLAIAEGAVSETNTPGVLVHFRGQ